MQMENRCHATTVVEPESRDRPDYPRDRGARDLSLA